MNDVYDLVEVIASDKRKFIKSYGIAPNGLIISENAYKILSKLAYIDSFESIFSECDTYDGMIIHISKSETLKVCLL